MLRATLFGPTRFGQRTFGVYVSDDLTIVWDISGTTIVRRGDDLSGSTIVRLEGDILGTTIVRLDGIGGMTITRTGDGIAAMKIIRMGDDDIGGTTIVPYKLQ